MKMSIITVCYNCENNIEETIKSVLIQKYKNIEYILVDGKSNDNTVEIIKKYTGESNNIRYISENDKGIYDAMNKGIKMSTGDIVFFLNSGDVFFDENVVLKIVECFKKDNFDVLYGNVIKCYNTGNALIKSPELNNYTFLFNQLICHQAIFAKKSIFSIVGNFNIEYNLCADFDWIIRCIKNKVKFKHINTVITFYEMDGITANKDNLFKIHIEQEKIIKLNYNAIIHVLFKTRHFIGKYRKTILKFIKEQKI